MSEEQSHSKPKSIKQIREMRKKEPKLVEGSKTTLIVKGSKTSEMVSKFMKDIKTLKRDNSVFYSRRNDTHPFDKIDDIQNFCKTTNSSLFLFGSNSKKRPNNVVLGRLYEYQLLDMIELGIENISSIEQFQTLLKIPTQTRPTIIFQGDSWETDSNLSKIKNILQDFFVQNVSVKEVEINNAMRLTITFSAYADKILMRTFEVLVTGKNILQDDGKVTIEQVGPKVDFVLRRTRFSDQQMWKQATKIAKPATKKSNKNIIRDNMGHKRGKLYMDRQNLETLGLRKTKALQKRQKFEAKVQQQKNNTHTEQFQS